MKFRFSDIQRPKRAATKIAAVMPNITLARAQEAVAVASGYSDWHMLHRECPAAKPGFLDSELTALEFHTRARQIIRRLWESLECSFSDAIYLYAVSRLTGDRALHGDEYHRLWLELMRSYFGFTNKRRSKGLTVKVKGFARPTLAVLRSFGQPSEIILHKTIDALCADHEVICPRKPLPPFVPYRLFLPYGYWTEPDGARVLFSRDYKPMWRIRDDRAPKRLDPKMWINFRSQDWFWEDANPPWYDDSSLTKSLNILNDLKITALPKLADMLFVALTSDKRMNTDGAVHSLEEFDQQTQIPRPV